MKANRMTHQVRGCYGFMIIFGQQTIKQLKPNGKDKLGQEKTILPSHRPIKRRDITFFKWVINNYLEFASSY
jgi:hypothetical protein